jgi:putative PIN family toxin of toxin-antitoxin system
MSRNGDRPRVVFDCNVMVQAVANEEGASGRAVGLLGRNQIHVFVSRAILKELRDVLNYPSVRRKLPALTDERIEQFLWQLIFRAVLLRNVAHVFDYPRATQDEPYIDAAAAAEATFLVSQDSDLLSLMTDHVPVAKEFRRRFPGLKIVTPPVFLSALSEAASA